MTLGARVETCRWVMLVGLASSACRPSVTVTPDPPRPRARPAPTAPEIELALANDVLCVRVGVRVHCGTNIDPAKSPLEEPAIELADGATSVAAGRDFVCVVTKPGTIWCRGSNTHGQLGAKLRAAFSESFVQVVGVGGALRVFAGDTHACAILFDGGVQCWGNNGSGQTGGSKIYAPEARELVTATTVVGVRQASTLALSDATSCATTTGKEVWCWGDTSGLHEHARARGPASEQPAAIAGCQGMQDIAAGDYLWCGIRRGDVACWGPPGALPSAIRERAETAGVDHEPIVFGLAPTLRVRIGDSHACALHADGHVSCWGANTGGALGRGSVIDHNRADPALVPKLPRATDLFVGGSMSCIVTEDREVYCWGRWPVVNGEPYRETGTPVKVEL